MKLCERLFSYKLEHDVSHLTDLSLHSEPCERQQCKRNARTKLPPVATKCGCTTTSHCFNLQVPSTTGALRSSCLLTSKWDTELQAETRCHDAVEPPPFPALLNGMHDKTCHADTKYKVAPAILIHGSVLILYTNIKTNDPKNSSIPWCRESHMFTYFHRDTFTRRRFYIQTLLHTGSCTHRSFHTQKLLHTEAFTHRNFYTQNLLHTEAFTHRSFYTQKLLHTEPFTHRSFYTQKLLHTDTFTHKDRTREIAILLQFLTFNIHFVRKGRDGPSKIAIFRSFWRRTSMSRVARDTSKSQFYISFWRSTSISCERVAMDQIKSQFFRSFWSPTSISCERVAFRGAPAAPPPP